MHYTIQKVINKNPYLFNGAYEKENQYFGKPIYMARYDGCQPAEELYFPKLKSAKLG